MPFTELHNATAQDRFVIELQSGQRLMFQCICPPECSGYFVCNQDLSTPELVAALCRDIFIRRPSWGLRHTLGQALGSMELRLEGGARPVIEAGRSLPVLGLFQGTAVAYQAAAKVKSLAAYVLDA